MLKLLPLGTALATIISAQVPEILTPAVNTAKQGTAITTALVVQPEPIVATTLPTTIAQARYRTPQQTDDSGQAGTLVVLGAIGATAAVAIASSTKNKFSSGTTKQGKFDQASPKLQKRLMTLLHNDQAAANRLIKNIKFHHPHQSTNWAIEKAIYDLERDRGGR